MKIPREHATEIIITFDADLASADLYVTGRTPAAIYTAEGLELVQALRVVRSITQRDKSATTLRFK